MGNPIYSTIAEKLGVPGSRRFISILDATFTPEEGEITFQLQGNPMIMKQLAINLTIEEKSLLLR